MRKKTMKNKGNKWEENIMKETNALKDVRDCNNELPTSAEEEGLESRNRDKKKKKKRKRHDNSSSNEVECIADGLPMSVEADSVRLRDGDKEKKKKKRHDVSENSVEHSANGYKRKKKRDDVSDNDFEVDASQCESVAESDVGICAGEKDTDRRREREAEFINTENESQKARKKGKKLNDAEISEVQQASKETYKGADRNASLPNNNMKDLGNNFVLDARKYKKKSRKENKNKNGNGNDRKELEFDMHNSHEKEESAQMNNGEEGNLKERKKKRKRDKRGSDIEGMSSIIDEKGVEKQREQFNGKIVDNVEDPRKKKNRVKKKLSNEPEVELQEMGDSSGIVDKDVVNNDDDAHSPKNEARGRKGNVNSVNLKFSDKEKEEEEEKEEKKKKKKKKKKTNVKSVKQSSEGNDHQEIPGAADPSGNPTSRRRSKKVSFSDHVEVFTSSDYGPSDGENIEEDGLVRGKRYTLEEDQMIKEAVANYIDTHMLGENGLDMVLNCKLHPEIKDCWKEIGAALPWRPCVSIYYRAHIIFQRSEERKWTPEELKLIKDHYQKNGSDWKSLADVLGKHRFHVKDAWRRHKLPNMKKGSWSQDEYQNLFDLVNIDLRLKACEEKKSKHGMLRDNICWGAISDKLETRNNATCCIKWYKQLQSPMVAKGIWADVDDYILLDKLNNLDACCIEDVDWDNLLEHRSGDICRNRWNQMVRHIGDNKIKSFAEQLEVLSKRYCPDIREAREAYDSKPAVP
ncbi:Myb_DNA-bind_6 domain-containing protein [Cephalotus follicularis]|uniref:Myb_DNA-bind_6 domain-containing protein n=1 Tax=Cephalotus follicularis TaxID=3775 RepID=A0A1Q3B868_CEPFO|nr:Myb_DNA-bind_6 domain-containing protein [Cephalotus follicularis]